MLNLIEISIRNPPALPLGSFIRPDCVVCGWPRNYKSVNKRGQIDSINSSLIMGSLSTNIMYKRMTFLNMGIDCQGFKKSCNADTDRDAVSFIVE